MNKRIYLSPSNQGRNAYITGNTTEKAVCEEIAGYVRKALERHGVDVFGWKPTLSERIAESNRIGVDVHMAIHTNASSSKAGQAGNAQGVTLFTELSGLKSKTCSNEIYKELTNIYPRPTKCRGVINGTFAEILQPRAATPYLEIAFHDNPEDVQWILDNKQPIAEAICKGLCAYFGINYRTPIETKHTPIMGESVATVAQMRAYLKAKNPSAPDYAALYLAEGGIEGVRGDIAFAQSLIETGNFTFTGDVRLGQNNFAGLGATGGGEPGCTFETPRIGIRAQIQHLKCYASTAPLATPCLDPRWGDWLREKAPYVEWLGQKENPNGVGWATGKGYGAAILGVMEAIGALQGAPAERPQEEPGLFKVYTLSGSFESASEARRFAVERDKKTIIMME